MKQQEGETVMTRQLISSGSTFEEQIGYSRAVVDGDWVFVSGTTGFDYAKMTIARRVVEQAEQCLRNIEAALKRRARAFADVVRVTYVLPGARIRAMLAGAAQALRRGAAGRDDALAGLADPRMKIEIEVTALKKGA